MSQQQLFYEDVFDVLTAAVKHAGGSKEVAEKLWPSKAVLQAQKELLDCLNRDSPRKLCIEEFMSVLKMAREAGFHQAKHWIDHETGYQSTPPLDPVIERDRLAESLQHAAQHFQELTRVATSLLEREQKLKSVR
jgi:hypothetical protein